MEEKKNYWIEGRTWKRAGHAGYIITCCHFDLGGNKYDCCQEPLFKTSNVACAQTLFSFCFRKLTSMRERVRSTWTRAEREKIFLFLNPTIFRLTLINFQLFLFPYARSTIPERENIGSVNRLPLTSFVSPDTPALFDRASVIIRINYEEKKCVKSMIS